VIAPLQHHRYWWALGGLLLAAIATLSLLPIHGPDLGLPQGDKWQHAFAYLVLTSYFGQLVASGWRNRFVLVLGLLGYGIGIELAQSFTPARQAELADLAANALGIALGLVLLVTPAGRTLAAIEARLSGDGRSRGGRAPPR
jgi:VanZ family protein